MTLNVVPTDVLCIIKSFLENDEIINLICLSKTFQHIFNKNIFTSLRVYGDRDLIPQYKHFMDHSKSIQKVYLYRLKDPHIFWSFDQKILLLVDCELSNNDLLLQFSEKIQKIVIKLARPWMNRYTVNGPKIIQYIN